jgi:hypothetical protein
MPRKIVEQPVIEPRHALPEQQPVPVQPARPAQRDFQPRSFNTEDLDIPTFLRNRSH